MAGKRTYTKDMVFAALPQMSLSLLLAAIAVGGLLFNTSLMQGALIGALVIGALVLALNMYKGFEDRVVGIVVLATIIFGFVAGIRFFQDVSAVAAIAGGVIYYVVYFVIYMGIEGVRLFKFFKKMMS